MAEKDTADRNQPATQKRLDDARKRGQVPRSPDLNAAAVTIAGGAALYVVGDRFASQLATTMRESLTIEPAALRREDTMLMELSAAMTDVLWALAPVLGLMLGAALIAPLAIGGWNMSAQALGFKSERINPLEGFKRMFSARGWIELVKSLAKFAVVAAIGALLLWFRSDDYLSLSEQPLRSAITMATFYCAEALLAISAGLAVIAAIDAPLQLWQYHRDLRMTLQEVREEARESEGAPEVKSRIRAAQQAMARRRMMQAVPTADVVITNPQHFAVALRYDDKRMRAPIVVAKGADDIAKRIREVAAEHGVPLLEAPPLARVLYRGVEIGAEIPAALYAAVAQVLSYVFQLRVASSSQATELRPPTIDPSVEDLIPRRGRLS